MRSAALTVSTMHAKETIPHTHRSSGQRTAIARQHRCVYETHGDDFGHLFCAQTGFISGVLRER